MHISFGRDKVEYEPTTKRFYRRQPGDFKPLRIHSNSLAKTHIVLGDGKRERERERARDREMRDRSLSSTTRTYPIHLPIPIDEKREMKTNNQYTMVAHPVMPSREILKRDEDLRASHV